MSKRRLITLESLSKKRRRSNFLKSEKIEEDNLSVSLENTSEMDDFIVDDTSEMDDYLGMEVELDKNKEEYLSSLSIKEKTKLFEEKERINNLIKCDVPTEYRIYNLNAPDKVKTTALKFMRMDDSEHSETRKMALNYICELPWGIYKDIAISMEDGYEQVNTFLQNAYNVMDKQIYGHSSAKHEIIEFISELILKPQTSRIIGLCGPPGIGKTSLVKYGIVNALGLPLQSVSLSGESGIAFLAGNEPVWKGSGPGCLITMFIDAKCMNPIIFIDEPDKVSNNNEGDNIGNFLVKFTDPEQSSNMYFKFLDLNIDVSKAIIILSYNNAENINPILLDRIRHIELQGFNRSDKIIIAQKYIIPKMLKEFQLVDKVSINIETIKYINKFLNPSTELSGVRLLIQGYQTLFSRIATNFLSSKIGFESLTTIIKKRKNKRKRQSHSQSQTTSIIKHPYSIEINDIPFVLTNADVLKLLK
jgi:ATP-dependent Lon protease